MSSETNTTITTTSSIETARPAGVVATAAVVPPPENNDANSIEASSVLLAAPDTNAPNGTDATNVTNDAVNFVAVTGAPPAIQMDKCAVRGCPKFPNPPCLMDICSFVGCSKFVHPVCYVNIICKSSGKKSARTAFDDISFCTASHHDMYAKSISENNLTWTNDGALGREDPLTSQHYLIQWLSEGDNYNRFRSPSGGRTKIDIAADVAHLINSKGVKVQRTDETFQAKIQWIQGCMRETYDWISGTGEGILENEGFDSLEVKVKFKCPFYYELEDKFICRTGIKPKITSYEIFSDPSSDDEVHGDQLTRNADENWDKDISDDGTSINNNTVQDKAKHQKSISISSSAKKKKSNSAGRDNDLESSISHLIHATLKRTKDIDQQKRNNGADIAALSSNFKQTADALGSRVKAALAFDKFEIFLSKEEKRELKELKDDEED